MKRNCWLKAALCLVFLLLLLPGTGALAEAKMTYTPENPKMGEYVDITVVPGREGALGVRYSLATEAETVFEEKEETTHYTASFRPRQEAVYTVTATIVYGKKDTETISVTVPVSGSVPVQEGPDVVYSQKDGWWKPIVYSKKDHRSLEKAGCAIFSLSHILQRLGNTGAEVLPDALAAKYSRFYIPERGTDNPGLINETSGTYHFVTQEDLIETERGIVDSLRRGDLLTFSIVLGHIAMADGISEDGTKVHVVDSAPGATFERKDRFKTKGHVFWQKEDGTFEEAATPDDLPGIRWFFESGEYGGMAYWLDTPYCAQKGMRLIRRPWLLAENDSGLRPVTLEYAGTLVSKVSFGEDTESVRIPTKDLQWTTAGAEEPMIAVITNKKGSGLVDGKGKPLARYAKKLNVGTMLMVLQESDDLCSVFWKDTFGYIARKDIDLLRVSKEPFSAGLVSTNGRTAGTAKVTIRNSNSPKGARVAEWTIGTPVAILAKDGEYYLVEGKGSRGWIHQKYLTPDDGESGTPE